jgi:hypothetical protein
LASTSAQLAFNYLPLTFTADAFSGGVVPYESAEQLTEIRDKLAGSHVVTKTPDVDRLHPGDRGGRHLRYTHPVRSPQPSKPDHAPGPGSTATPGAGLKIPAA